MREKQSKSVENERKPTEGTRMKKNQKRKAEGMKEQNEKSKEELSTDHSARMSW